MFLKKNYAGLEVRDAHLQMAKETKRCPAITLPEDRGAITVSDVLAEPAGDDRDEMISQLDNFNLFSVRFIY